LGSAPSIDCHQTAAQLKTLLYDSCVRFLKSPAPSLRYWMGMVSFWSGVQSQRLLADGLQGITWLTSSALYLLVATMNLSSVTAMTKL